MAIKIIQGETKVVNIDVISEKTGKAFDLTGFTEITVCLVSGTVTVELTETGGRVAVVGDPKFGQLTLTLTVAESTSLPETITGDIEVAIDKSGAITKTQTDSAFIVRPKICAA